jgi:myo-inositol-1-phosphate synthase
MSKKIRVAVVGVGNCLSSLYQGLEYYKDHDEENIPGIMFSRIGGYHPADIQIVAAFDVDRRKIVFDDIKTIGQFEANINLVKDINASITLEVVAD